MTELDQLEDAIRQGDTERAYELAWIIMLNCDYPHDSVQRRAAHAVIQAEVTTRAQMASAGVRA